MTITFEKYIPFLRNLTINECSKSPRPLKRLDKRTQSQRIFTSQLRYFPFFANVLLEETLSAILDYLSLISKIFEGEISIIAGNDWTLRTKRYFVLHWWDDLQTHWKNCNGKLFRPYSTFTIRKFDWMIAFWFQTLALSCVDDTLLSFRARDNIKEFFDYLNAKHPKCLA